MDHAKDFKPKLLYSTVSWEQNLSFVPPLLCCTFVGPSGQHHPAISIIFSKAGGPRPCHAGGLSMALGTEQCAVCGRSAVGTCPLCRKVGYCSRSCQKLDWLEDHATLCDAPQLALNGQQVEGPKDPKEEKSLSKRWSFGGWKLRGCGWSCEMRRAWTICPSSSRFSRMQSNCGSRDRCPAGWCPDPSCSWGSRPFWSPLPIPWRCCAMARPHI